jgi:glycosyltransferase involved in cell wall biosynthesis
VTLSVAIITYNEEANLGRALQSVLPLVRDGKGEIIVVDSGSTDRTVEIARSHGAKVFLEEWKGYARQKNSAIEKATGEWVLSLDADEEVGPELAALMAAWTYPLNIGGQEGPVGFWLTRKNYFLGRWIKHGGFWPDPKLRLFRRGQGVVRDALVHETIQVSGTTAKLNCGLIHHSYPTVSDYIAHMNRYSSLGAEMTVAKGKRRFLLLDLTFRPVLTFVYNYFFRLGFLDGHEGLLLHLSHAAYVWWKYAKVWEIQHQQPLATRYPARVPSGTEDSGTASTGRTPSA